MGRYFIGRKVYVWDEFSMCVYGYEIREIEKRYSVNWYHLFPLERDLCDGWCDEDVLLVSELSEDDERVISYKKKLGI